MTITPEDIARWRELAEKATPGPWTVEWEDYENTDQSPYAERPCSRIEAPSETVVIADSGVYPPAGFTAALICEMRNNWTRLLSALEESRQTARENGSILANVNDAIGRAGIHCAITFVEAIDKIAAERDQLRAALEESRAEVERLKLQWLADFGETIAERDRLKEECSALRSSLIHACELRSLSHEHERQLWAMRQAANLLTQPFSHDRVQDEYNEWPSRAEELDRLRDELTMCKASNASLRAYHDDNEAMSAALAEMTAARDELASIADEAIDILKEFDDHNEVPNARARSAELRAVGRKDKP